jgi:N-acetylglucosamine kinase
MHVLGIDVGGTKTTCFLGDDHGRVVTTAGGQGANLQTVGELELEKVLHAVMEEATTRRSVTPAAICLGIAGVDRPDDAAIVRGIMDRIGYKARVLVVNDALIALQAGIGSEPGVVIVAGTGSIAYGCDRHGFAARAGGWGYGLGDEGSGYWMGRMALHAVVRAADGRSEPTALTGFVLDHFGIARPQELLPLVRHADFKPASIATVAMYLQQACELGDAVAAGIVERAAQELTTAAASVTTRLALAGDTFVFVLSGGMFKALPRLRSDVERLLAGIAPTSTCLHLEVEPALGALRLALAEIHGGARLPVYKS